jgi:hypothetical protein
MKPHKLTTILKSTSLLVLGLVAFACSSNAAVWYVDNNATGANNGTSWANAWRSVTSVSGVKAGDIIYVSGGAISKTYTGVSDWQPPSGTQGSPISFKHSTDVGHSGTVVFDGAGAQFFLRNGGTFHDITLDFWDGLTQRASIINYGTVVYADGAVGFTLLGASFNSPIRMAYSAVRYEIGFCYIDLNNGADHAITLGAPGAATGWGVNKIHNNTILLKRQNSGSGFGDDGIQWGNSCDMYSNYFKGVPVASYTAGQHQDGIQTDGRYTRIFANTFENFGNSCVYPDIKGNSSDFYVYNNVFLRTDPALNGAQRGIDDGSDGVAGVSFSNHQFWNNTFVGFTGIYAIGMYAHGLSGIVWINCAAGNNIFQDCSGGGLVVDSTVAKYNNVYSGNTPNAGNISGGGAGNVAFLAYVANSTNMDLHLAPTATIAIDKGTAMPASMFNVDKDGNARPAGSAWDVGAYEFGSTGGGGGGVNLPPSVSAIATSATDVDLGVSGLQVYESTTVSFGGSAFDPEGSPITWQWKYSVNGGSQITYSSGSGAVASTNFTFGAGTAGSTYVWTLSVSDGTNTTQSQLTIGVESPQINGTGLTIAATSGVITNFTVGANFISQGSTVTDPNAGGSAVYTFAITNAGYYLIQAVINAPDASANSVYVNIDAQPQEPTMVWDVVTMTSGFEPRIVSWRGTGTPDNNQYVPKFFNLTQGTHQLVVRGREANTQIQSFKILQTPAPPPNFRVLPNVVNTPATFSAGF